MSVSGKKQLITAIQQGQRVVFIYCRQICWIFSKRESWEYHIETLGLFSTVVTWKFLEFTRHMVSITVVFARLNLARIDSSQSSVKI
jgi:hypothetical protein